MPACPERPPRCCRAMGAPAPPSRIVKPVWSRSMKGKVILVIMDGVGFDTAVSRCGFLEGMVELGRARRWRMRAALPTISAPLYETLHTGVPPIEHGIVANEALRPSTWPN